MCSLCIQVTNEFDKFNNTCAHIYVRFCLSCDVKIFYCENVKMLPNRGDVVMSFI